MARDPKRVDIRHLVHRPIINTHRVRAHRQDQVKCELMRGDQPQVACAWTAVERSRAKPRLLLSRPREREHRSEGSLDRAPPRAIRSSGQPPTAETAAKPIWP